MSTKALAAHHFDVKVETSHGSSSVHYVEAGDYSKPTLLLLHGFPSSSTQFRDFIALLSDDYHVLAPDYPGFGLTKVPDNFVYTFDNLAIVISAWLTQLEVTSYSAYIFQYGAAIGFRLFLANPGAIKAIITQNGNTYIEGFGQVWAPLFKLWDSNNDPAIRQMIVAGALSEKAIMDKYFDDVPEQDKPLLDPEQPLRDYLQNIVGKEERHVDLFYDYRTNRDSYPKWQRYLRESKVPVLAVWGKYDPSFIPPGAEAYKKDSDAEVHLIEAGHFALETARWEVAKLCKEFLGRQKL